MTLVVIPLSQLNQTLADFPNNLEHLIDRPLKKATLHFLKKGKILLKERETLTHLKS